MGKRIFWIILTAIIVVCFVFGIHYYKTKTYNITASADPNGKILPSGTIIVKNRSDQEFTIIPSNHYHISDVIVDGASIGPMTHYTFEKVSKPHSIKAFFAIDTNTISESAGPNGSISPNGKVQVSYGADQTFTITVNSCQSIISVTVDGANKGAINSYTFKNVTAPHSIGVIFSNTLTYRIGEIDSRFNISRSTFSKILEDAANRWNKVGRKLLKYCSSGEVEVNLTYGYRQAYLDDL